VALLVQAGLLDTAAPPVSGGEQADSPLASRALQAKRSRVSVTATMRA
jgi:hypothetical protein